MTATGMSRPQICQRPREQADQGQVIQVSRDQVYYLLRTRQLRSIKIGKSRLIADQRLAAFIASREDNNAA